MFSFIHYEISFYSFSSIFKCLGIVIFIFTLSSERNINKFSWQIPNLTHFDKLTTHKTTGWRIVFSHCLDVGFIFNFLLVYEIFFYFELYDSMWMQIFGVLKLFLTSLWWFFSEQDLVDIGFDNFSSFLLFFSVFFFLTKF